MFCTNRTAGGKQDGNIFSDDPDLGTVCLEQKECQKDKRRQKIRTTDPENTFSCAVREEVQREVRQARTISKPRKATAVPNKPRRQKLTREEEALKPRSRASSQACTYEAAYSKGKPDRVGGRGDYETVTPNGMERIRCGYCGAQNFVPVGSRNHYHCYFCWEKL